MRDGGLRLPFPEIDQDMCFVSLIDAYGELRSFLEGCSFGPGRTINTDWGNTTTSLMNSV